MKNLRYLVMDLETTGFDPQNDRPIEVGATWIHDLKVVETYSSYCSPGDRAIPPDASGIHHIVAEDLVGAPEFKEVLSIIERKGEYDVIVAHNARFDMQWIAPPSRIPVIDTLRLAQKLWPRCPNFKNQTLRYFLQVAMSPEERRGMAHSAGFDTLVTAGIFIKAVEALYERAKAPEDITVEKVQKWLTAPLDLRQSPMKFGKHRGKTWAQVAVEDRSYLEWFMGPKCSMEKDQDQIFTVNTLLGRS